MAIGKVAGIIVALGARVAVCSYKEIPWKKSAVFNSVDMLISSWMSRYLLADKTLQGSEDKDRDHHVCNLLISRVVSVISGLLVTAAIFGPMDPVVAIALNTVSLASFFFTDFAIQKNQQDPFGEPRPIWYP